MADRAMARFGIAVSALVALMLAGDAGVKIFAPAIMIANTPAALGMPADPGHYRMLGAILGVCVALYVWPRTRLLGAILLTGYLGGAVATHVRVGDPLVSHTLFGVYIGIAVWLGLWLRDPRLRALLSARPKAWSARQPKEDQ